MLCLDIDKFKEINDAADHSGGDQVLRDIGARIQATLREGDLIARLGADEFAIALVDITNLGDVMAFMNRLVEALRRPLQVAGKEMLVTTSVGIALAPADGDTATTVLRHAGIALARAKGDGGQRMCFFEQSMDKALQRRRMVEHELRLALGREEFEVVYQPQYDLATERQCGSEALIRWHHPVHGKIAPGHFISVAEDTGLIVPLGEWVLRRACRDAVSWPEPLFVSVNLSPAQFRDGDVAETVAQVLKETGLPPERLELEITESLLINDTDEVLGKLNRLRQLGVHIAMDDFGTGYSSLSYLARFPFSKIKIDRQFIRNMTRDPAMRAIVKTIIALGKSLDVTITAEGVETEEQAAMLREFGCPQVQGFLYGYPGAADDGKHARRRPRSRPSRRREPAQPRIPSDFDCARTVRVRSPLSLPIGRRTRTEQPAQSPVEGGDLGLRPGGAVDRRLRRLAALSDGLFGSARCGLGLLFRRRLRLSRLLLRRRGVLPVLRLGLGTDIGDRTRSFGSGLGSSLRAGRFYRRLRLGGLLCRRQGGGLVAILLDLSHGRRSRDNLDIDGSGLRRAPAARPGQSDQHRHEQGKADGMDDASVDQEHRHIDLFLVHGSEERRVAWVRALATADPGYLSRAFL